MMYGGWMWGNGWVWMGVGMVLFWVAVATAVVFAIRYLLDSGRASGGSPRYDLPRPEDVLSERFAQGEIDEDEYRQRVALLQKRR